jgi:hypothetical protein
MSAEIQNSNTQSEELITSRKKGIITGIRDRSEVEAMIERYLELAQSALKEDAPALKEKT